MHHRLLMAGHHDDIRPSGISTGLAMKEEILTDIEADVFEMRTKEECRLPPITDG